VSGNPKELEIANVIILHFSSFSANQLGGFDTVRTIAQHQSNLSVGAFICPNHLYTLDKPT